VAAPIRTGSPLFETTRAGRIIEWNRSAEELSAIPSSEAVGRSCWDVIRGRDAAGGLICHPGCSVVRLAREGWPVRCTDLAVSMPSGVKRLMLSTIVVGAGEDTVVLHPMEVVAPDAVRAAAGSRAPKLTPRQREILALLVEGLCAKEIATRLSLSVATVRNHIHALLSSLGVNSQLAAVARARELGLCDAPSAAGLGFTTAARRR